MSENSTTTADKLQDLIDAKADMKAAIEEKGVEITGGLVTYADAIQQIKYNEEIALHAFHVFPGTKLSRSNFIEKQIVVDLIDVVDASRMFEYANCDEILIVGSGNATNMSYMFHDLRGRYASSQYITDITIHPFDTSSATNMQYMFYEINKYKDSFTIPEMDTSNVVDMNHMFSICRYITTIPEMDTSNVVDMTSMFAECNSLEKVPLLNGDSLEKAYSMFFNCSNLTDIGGISNFGKVKYMELSDWTFRQCPNISRQSCLNIFNNLYDRMSAGYSTLTLSFEQDVIDRLDASDIAIATNKGWNIASI